MTIKVALNHRTEYVYDRLITMSPHVIRLRPAVHARTPIEAYSLKITPQPHFLNWQQDPFGNYLARVVFPEKVKEFKVEVDLVANMVTINPFDYFLDENASKFPFRYEANLRKELAPYLEILEKGPLLSEWLKKVNLKRRNTNDFLVELNQMLEKDIDYVIRMEPGIQKCEETLQLAKGSCRDSAWLLVQILRHLGLAARFTSGYLIQLKPDQKSLDGPSGTEVDFTDLHAWAEVYLPGAGWLGMDPTSGLFASEGHIPLACTPHPVDAAPITGLLEECESTMKFHMEVNRIYEDPRVTKPYTEEAWEQIRSVGQDIDARLKQSGIKMLMGGEPTFVSIDYPDDPEWNIAAMGPNKRRLAEDLMKRLQKHFSSSAVFHYGQGKWYPGEPLPRWALGCFWLKDGEAIWQDPTLQADESKNPNYGAAEAEKFIHTLAKLLSLPSEHIVAGHEDVYYYLWKEGNLPGNIKVDEVDWKDDLERARLRKLLEKDLGETAGYALPLVENFGNPYNRWRSSRWTFRRETMFLIPGDSPMGYRLPLESLPWLPAEAKQPFFQQDPFDARQEVDNFRQLIHQRLQDQGEAKPLIKQWEGKFTSQTGYKADGMARTALCVEPRNGNLYIFLPPLTYLESWLDLIGCIELTAAELNMPVLIEGYEPPKDWRLQFFRITPDPGVIEVNIQPAANWEELEFNTSILYEEARLARLTTEKFEVDGKHTGTGGGNHVTIGGSTPADSPFLQRPDLLQSFVNFWQNHPSLSYLFSSMFIGPTSQAPRVDEARNDSLYNLEIAFSEVTNNSNPAPWLVDRVFRHLLTDLTGNVHRSEFCIDKLYSPEGPAGRMGVVEMRAFEMPPHSRMSLTQMILLRGLLSYFWEHPYNHKLVPWQTDLHDRFMLPHYVWEDFKDVIKLLNGAGYSIELDWYRPFLEFRFPRFGTIGVDTMTLEIRHALEPWNVLGEEATGSGTARYVDSSVERLQIKVDGITSTRHIVTCNGRRLPLRKTSTMGQAVAGVRYRAWHPWSALHPTIGVHSPLVFDIIDSWNQRSIGGCTYHVSHPGGRAHETRPINALEAESRRVARFWDHGHTPGKVSIPPEEPNPWFPCTLDLRTPTE